MEAYQKICHLISSDLLDEALLAVNSAIGDNPDEGRLYFLAGKIHSRLGNRSAAISAYSKAVELNPDDKASQTALEMARGIEDFFNPDLLNP